jgi:tetratricopeptide (TPR) repeat protein
VVAGRLQLAQAYRDQGLLDAAIQEYEAALKLDPGSSHLHLLLGSALYQKGDREAGRTYFERAVALDPDSGAAANNLAAANAELGRNLDEALSLAMKARQLSPDLPETADTLAWIQYRKGLYQTALPLLEDCVRKAPQTAVFHYHLGMVLAAMEQKEKARTHLETALRLRLSGEDAEQAKETLAKIR